MTPEEHAKVLAYLESLRTGVAVWKLGAFDGLADCIAIMRKEQEPQPCPNGEPCKHSDWCSEVYCQGIPCFRNQYKQEPISDAEKPTRMAFEHYWLKTRGGKKARRELERHPLQPQTYRFDSPNRHWITWQAALLEKAR